jgi:hypothetical protein
MNDLNDLRQRVDNLEPKLLQRIWPPMTYMLIPNVLKAADEIITELQSPSMKNDPEAVIILARITDLRANFKRDA